MRPGNRVEELLLASSLGEQPHAAFVAALRDAPLLVIKPTGDQRPAPGDQAGLTLPVVEREGRSYVPAFTSVGQLQVAFPGGSGYFELPARALAESLPPGHWLAINLDGDLGLPLDPREILASDAGNAQAVALPAGAQVALGEPAQEPTALLSQLTELARRHHEVSAAYRCLMVVRGPDERPQLVIGFLVEAGASADELLSAAACLTGEDVLMSVLDPDGTSAIDRYMLDETQPFYVAPPA